MNFKVLDWQKERPRPPLICDEGGGEHLKSCLSFSCQEKTWLRVSVWCKMQQEKRSLAFSWARERADCIRRSGAKASVSWKNPQWEHTISSDVNDELASGSFFFFFSSERWRSLASYLWFGQWEGKEVDVPGPELSGSRSCSCTTDFQLTASCIASGRLLFGSLFHFLPRLKGPCVGKVFPCVCPSDFPLVERWEGAVAETCWLLSTQIIQTAEERNALFCKLAFPTGRKQRPNVLKEAAARCFSPWNLPAGYSHWDRRWRLLLSIRPGDVRRNGWEHAFTSCSRNPSV